MSRRLLVLVLLASACGPKAAPEPAVEAAQASAETGVEMVDGMPVAVETPEQKEARLKEGVVEAVELLGKGDVESAKQALSKLQDAKAVWSDDATLHYNIGIAQEQLGDSDSARKAYLRATDIDPTLGDAWVNLAGMYMRDGSYDRALRSYKAGIRSDGENLALRVGLIGALRGLGRLDEAYDEAKAALKINANSPEVYNNLGLIYLDRGQLELAQFTYQKALYTLDGADQNALLHCNLGIVYVRQAKRAEAKTSFEKALELDPDLVPAMVYLSDYYLQNRNYGDTVGLLEKARTLRPDDPAIRMNLGVGYRGTGRYEEAKKEFEKALDLDTEDPSPWLNLGILYGDYMKAYDAAVDAYQRYIDRGGEQASLVQGYIDETMKEQERVKKLEARKAKLEEDRVRREKQKKLLEEQRAKEEAEKAAEEAEQAQPAEEAPADGAQGGSPIDPNAGMGAPAEEAPTEDAPAEGEGSTP